MGQTSSGGWEGGRTPMAGASTERTPAWGVSRSKYTTLFMVLKALLIQHSTWCWSQWSKDPSLESRCSSRRTNSWMGRCRWIAHCQPVRRQPNSLRRRQPDSSLVVRCQNPSLRTRTIRQLQPRSKNARLYWKCK
jgi:hypothetical protein